VERNTERVFAGLDSLKSHRALARFHSAQRDGGAFRRRLQNHPAQRRLVRRRRRDRRRLTGGGGSLAHRFFWRGSIRYEIPDAESDEEKQQDRGRAANDEREFGRTKAA